jgi:hypothetical protein
MMIECPKCGFVQPKDKYCANCGLDIETYKPAPDPMMVRLKRNTALQGSAIVFIIVIMAIAIFISQRERIARHLEGAIPALKRSMPQPEITAEPYTGGSAPTPRNTEPPPPTALAAKAAPSVAAEEAPKIPKELNVGFYEISKAAILQLAGEGQILNETPQTRSFLLHVPDVAAKIKETDSESRTHGEPHAENFVVGTPINLDYTHMGGKGATESVGLTIVLTPTSMAESLWEFAFEANINLKNETGGSLLSTSVNGNYSIPPKSALLLAGFLPHQKVSKEDLWSFNGSPLMIYESPYFLNNLTEFVIVIEPK